MNDSDQGSNYDWSENGSDEEDFEYLDYLDRKSRGEVSLEEDFDYNFITDVRNLLHDLPLVQMSHENFNKKISLIVQVFENISKFSQILLSGKYDKFVETVKNKIVEFNEDLPATYNKYNTMKRLDPESKKSYRKLRDLLLEVEAKLMQPHYLPTTFGLISVEDDAANEIVEQQQLRRSPRLAAKQQFI